MPARITIACEHCGAKLTLADDSKLGKKIKCPKCSEVFVAAANDDEIEDVDDEVMEEDEDERPRKKAAAAAGAGKGKKGKGGKGKKSSGGNMGLVIGGAAVVGVLLIGGLVGVLFATGVLGGGAPKSNPNQIAIGPGAPNGVVGKLLQDQPANPSVPAPTPDAKPATPATPNTPATPPTTPAVNPAPTQAAPAGPARSPAPETAKWLPADSEMLVHVRIADILSSPLITEIIKTNRLEDTVNTPLPQIGLKASDVESITIGMSGLEQTMAQAQAAQLAVMSGQPPEVVTTGTASISVVKLKKPVSYDLIMQAAMDAPMTRVQFAGKEYLQATDPRAATKLGIWLPAPTEVVFGDEASLKNLLEKGAASAGPAAFGFVDWTDHLLLAVAPKDPAAIRKLRPPESTGNPLFDQMITTFVEGTNGVSIGLTVTGGIEFEAAFGGVDPAKTEAIVKSLNDAVGLGKLQYDQSKKDIPPWAATLTDQLMENIIVTGDDRVAIFATQVPESSQKELAQLPSMIMTQIMLGAMMGGGPGGGDIDFSSGSNSMKSAVVIPEKGPENIKLTATLMQVPDFMLPGDARGKKSKKKERVIDMSITAVWTGDKDSNELAAGGKLKPKGGESSDGKKIKVAVGQSLAGGDQKANEVQPITVLEFGEPTLTLGSFNLTIPDDESEPLKSVSGVCTIVTGKQVKQVTVPNIKQQAGKEPEDEDLKAAGFQVKITQSKGPIANEMIVVSVKDGYLLSRLSMIDKDGSPVFAMAENDKNERSQHLILFGDDVRQNPNLGIQAYLYSDLKEVSVPFTFEDVEIPEKREETTEGGEGVPKAAPKTGPSN